MPAAEHEVAKRIRDAAARLRAALAAAMPEDRLEFTKDFIDTHVDEDIRRAVFDWWILGHEQGNQMTEHKRFVTKSKIYVLISTLGFLFGLALVIGGVLLTYLGATGSSTVKLFGQTLESQTVGIPAFFIGAVVVVLLLRNVLRNLK